MIRSRFSEGKGEELFEGQTIIDLVFEFRIVVDMEPFLKHRAFKQEQRRISIFYEFGS
jgi:hypothetical protein